MLLYNGWRAATRLEFVYAPLPPPLTPTLFDILLPLWSLVIEHVVLLIIKRDIVMPKLCSLWYYNQMSSLIVTSIVLIAH